MIHASLALTVIAMVLVLCAVGYVYFGGGAYATASRQSAYGVVAALHGGLSAVAVFLALVGSVRARRAAAPNTARFGVVAALLASFGVSGTAVLVAFWWMAGQLPAN